MMPKIFKGGFISPVKKIYDNIYLTEIICFAKNFVNFYYAYFFTKSGSSSFVQLQVTVITMPLSLEIFSSI